MTRPGKLVKGKLYIAIYNISPLYIDSDSEEHFFNFRKNVDKDIPLLYLGFIKNPHQRRYFKFLFGSKIIFLTKEMLKSVRRHVM
jgi:hypothetical protein